MIMTLVKTFAAIRSNFPGRLNATIRKALREQALANQPHLTLPRVALTSHSGVPSLVDCDAVYQAETRIQFSWAAQIQPRTGQQIQEWRDGVRLAHVRPWTAAHAGRFSQCSKALLGGDGWALVVDADNEVFLVPADELAAAREEAVR